MRLLYVANIRLPTEKAHGIQIMKMCEVFANAGHEVTLVVPRRFNHIKSAPFKYYGVKENFTIKKLPTIDLVKFGKIGFLIQTVSFSKFALLYSAFNKVDIIYSRDEIPIFFLSFLHKNIFWESHTDTYNFFVKSFIKKIKGMVVITKNLKDFYLNKGVNNSKILVAADAVDLKEFNIPLTRKECRERLNLPKGKTIVMYTGHLYGWKGVGTLVKTSEFLNENTVIVFVGGTDEDVKIFREKYASEKILVLGQKLHKEIPYYLKSADVLVLPNSTKSDVSRLYTSPMKMFEYMASGIPIVASDLPSIKEVLTVGNSILVAPDNPKELADGIKKALNKDGKKAMEDVKQYTWQKRATKILGTFT